MKTVVNIKVDKKIKIKAQELAEDFGLSLSAVLNAYLKQFVREEKIIFSKAPSMSVELENLLKNIEPDLKKNKNLSQKIKTKENLDSYFASL
jgi:addiction module RelB/DinJ family antitoxin